MTIIFESTYRPQPWRFTFAKYWPSLFNKMWNAIVMNVIFLELNKLMFPSTKIKFTFLLVACMENKSYIRVITSYLQSKIVHCWWYFLPWRANLPIHEPDLLLLLFFLWICFLRCLCSWIFHYPSPPKSSDSENCYLQIVQPEAHWYYTPATLANINKIFEAPCTFTFCLLKVQSLRTLKLDSTKFDVFTPWVLNCSSFL